MFYIDIYENTLSEKKALLKYYITLYENHRQEKILFEQVITLYVNEESKHTFPILTLSDSLAVLDFKNIFSITYNRKYSIKIFVKQIPYLPEVSTTFKVFYDFEDVIGEQYFYSIDKQDKNGNLHKFYKYFFPEKERHDNIFFNFYMIPDEFKALENFKQDKYEFVSETFHAFRNHVFKENEEDRIKENTISFIEQNMNELFGFKNWIWERVQKDYIDFEAPFPIEQMQYIKKEEFL